MCPASRSQGPCNSLPAMQRRPQEMCVDTLRPFCYSICFAFFAYSSRTGSDPPVWADLKKDIQGDMTISKAYAQIAKAAAYQRRNLYKNFGFGLMPSRLRLLGIAMLAFVGASLLVGCGGGSSGITLEVIPNTAQMVDQGQNIFFNAIVSPDPNNKGVTWMTPTGSGCAGTG